MDERGYNMKKSTGWILFGLAAGVACGVGYYAYKNKDKFIKEEIDVTPDGEIVTKRTYVGLDMDDVKTKANDAVKKTKKAARQTIQLVNDKIDSMKSGSFDLEDEDEEIIYEDFTSVVADEEVTAPEADFVTFDIKADAKAEEVKEEAKEEVAEATEEPKKETKSKAKKN